jgi:hypothetical protein
MLAIHICKNIQQCRLTLQPPDLRCGTVSLVVPGRNPEYDGRFSAGVDVRGSQIRIGNDALGLRAAENPDKGQLAGGAGNGLGVTLRRRRRALYSQVYLQVREMPC